MENRKEAKKYQKDNEGGMRRDDSKIKQRKSEWNKMEEYIIKKYHRGKGKREK